VRPRCDRNREAGSGADHLNARKGGNDVF
jgi:hypothetical protein